MAEQGRQGGNSHLNHPPDSVTSTLSIGRGLKVGRGLKRRSLVDKTSQHNPTQANSSEEHSEERKRPRLVSHLPDQESSQPSDATRKKGSNSSANSRKERDLELKASLNSDSSEVLRKRFKGDLQQKGGTTGSLVPRGPGSVVVGTSSNKVGPSDYKPSTSFLGSQGDKAGSKPHKQDRRSRIISLIYRSVSSAGDKSSAGTSKKGISNKGHQGSCSSSSSCSSGCSGSRAGGELSGVKKLLNHYSLRSQVQNKPLSKHTDHKNKKHSTTQDAAGVEGSSSEGVDKESSCRRTATTGSCTSTSRRWGGGGGGGLSNSSKVGDCSNMAEEQPPCDNATPSGTGNGSVGGGGTGGGIDSESDDSEVGRLQALLEARGLPPHLFGALAPRMHHLLHRTIGTNTTTKAQQLLQGLQATSDEGQQMQAVIEMCQMLVMGNEDTLAGFPIKQVVPALIALLNMEHNFDMMNQACRALTYMMEALPRSSAVVLDAVPVFLEKLQAIQCMDVAEQSLTALEMLSRRHSKAILQARGVWACLMYLDFFSINAQRAALAITANCCHNLLPEELPLVSQSIPLLSSRLTHQDQKSVESVCLALSRLTDSLQSDPSKLMQIANSELLTNLQQLLVVSPPLINTGTFITVVRMLTTMCANCPELSLTLLKNNIAETLCYLLTGRADTSQGEIELVARSPQEVYEMTCLISELMPRLPQHALFAVDTLLDRPSPKSVPEAVTWLWRDDMGVWHAYTPIDSRIIEEAHQSGEEDMSLSTLGRTYTVDFQSMQQINEDTGTSRPIERRVTRPQALLQQSTTSTSSNYSVMQTNNNNGIPVEDSNIDNNLKDVAGAFIKSLFSVLYEVYSSSAGPAVRCKCLKALLRMVYFASPELLKEVLKAQTVSSQLAGMMASQDLRIVVSALQIAEILMQKLPEVFSVHFTREGVMHEIKQLADPAVPIGSSPSKPIHESSSIMDSSTPGPSSASSTPNGAAYKLSSEANANEGQNENEEGANVEEEEMPLSDCSPITRRMRELRKPKRSTKREKHSKVSEESTVHELFTKHKHANNLSLSSRGTRSRMSGASSKTSNFLASLNPARWGRASERNFQKVTYLKESTLAKCASSSNLWAGNREKVRTWVRERSSKFIANYSTPCENSEGLQDPNRILTSLTQAISALQAEDGTDKMAALIELRNTLMRCDISPFEVNHSGLVKALLEYLTHKTESRDSRIRTFLHVFAKCPLEEGVRELTTLDPTCLQVLISKLNSCVSQLEQFPVKVHDLPAPAGSTTALRFFNTHQLKCQLFRHPDCTSLKQWKGGTVKIDPLALVQAIERYMVVRGYAKVRDKHSSQSDDDNSEEDIDDTLLPFQVGMVVGSARHKLQFLINDTVLPYNMTVYQAVRQFSPAAAPSDQSETDTDTEAPFGSANIWVQTHTVHYRPVVEDETPSKPVTNSNPVPRKGKGSNSKAAPKKKYDGLWQEGKVPVRLCAMERYLVSDLSDKVTTNDASLPVLCLLKALHAISMHWTTLYPALQGSPILYQQEFVNNKIAAKAGRQLQDPLVILTGNLPSWLQQITAACPFLLPFETRQLLLYATAFDRDRALQRLLDASPELSGSSDSQERVTPRLDRRKRTVAREDILKQAESLIQDMASSKALLEVQYENEVGTGLGPTLEFYALVSKELQKSELELWHDEGGGPEGYVYSPVGLFPAPIPRSTRVSQLMKLRTKFRFIGKFMAKAVMDSRMLDLPLSQTFHRWLLGEESSLGLTDLAHVNPSVYKSLVRLMQVVARYKEILNAEGTEEEKNANIDALELDGCPIESLSLDFTLPGYPHIELRRGGKDIAVTVHNLEEYCKVSNTFNFSLDLFNIKKKFVQLVVHWYLVEGVYRQMECVREGMQCVFPISHLVLFYPQELDAVFCGSSTSWELSSIVESCRPDHGYNPTSRAIKFLFEILSAYGPEEQRDFIQFITGSPRLPVGGFKSLTPPLTIVRKTIDGNMNADDFLPSVMTCVNYLKLPDYSTVEIMREKLSIAAKEGQRSFHLS
ncbi:E3 ubiquitin-protein ligase TRIP12 isoform X4 [Cimex lectularius]|uniref:E3 ubiquitin-protein ligase n=1 Tax=Cimex lectularius TaxID=79782 RepID=A0A8I6SE55_CIMLE|nr:E3 ubiquitin-protein ligase TRIP12 isoform X4 [Cimex lectularius]